VSLTLWILLLLTIVYIPLYFWVRSSPKAAKYGLVKYGPCIMIKTQLGTKLMDRWCVYTRFWRFFGILSQIISFVLMVGIIYILAVGVMNLASSLNADGIGIEYALAIPGLNPLLPLWYGILGLFVAMVLHELAHGMQTKSNNMRVSSTGLLYGVVPLGAFVEPNEEDVKKSSRRVKLDLYSAGISTNLIVAIIAFTLFAVVMLGGISSPYGDSAAIYSTTSDSPASDTGLPSGVIIEYVNGEEYDINASTYSWDPGESVEVKYIAKDGEYIKNIQWGVYIESISDSSPASGVLTAKTFLISITSNGDETLLWNQTQFTSYMKTTSPGETVTIACMTEDGTVTTHNLTLGTKGSVGYVGIVTSTSGMYFTTPNTMLDEARNPIYGADSLTSYATSLIGYIAGPFTGFSPMPESVQWWYDVPLDGVFWIFVSILYWIFWLNIMLGVSNAIPAYPFDGGFIFLGWLDKLLEKMGMKDMQKRMALADTITSYLSIVMIMLYVLVIVAVVL